MRLGCDQEPAYTSMPPPSLLQRLSQYQYEHLVDVVGES
jgi:hypothetical protein